MDSTVNKRNFRVAVFALSTMKFAFGISAILVLFFDDLTWFMKWFSFCSFIAFSFFFFKIQAWENAKIIERYNEAKEKKIPLNRRKRKMLARWQRKNNK